MRELPKARRLRTGLIVLVCAVLLPMGIFSVAVVRVYTGESWGGIERGLRGGGRNLALSVDAQLAGYAAALQTLATSASLDSGDLAIFHRAAVRAHAANPDWLAITLADSTGRLLVTDVRPSARPLTASPRRNIIAEGPRGDREGDARLRPHGAATPVGDQGSPGRRHPARSGSPP